MKSCRLALVIAALVALASTGATSAHDEHDHGTAPETAASPAANTGTGALYFTIRNDGDQADRLLSASTDAAQTIEMHAMEMDGEVMRMSPLPDGVEIPAGESVSFDPQVMHLMLVNLTRDLRAGDAYQLTLTFERAGEVTIDVTVAIDAPEDGASVTAGDLTIEHAWSLPAPMITGVAPEATPHAMWTRASDRVAMQML